MPRKQLYPVPKRQNDDGFNIITLERNGKEFVERVDKIMLRTFVGEAPNPSMIPEHINGDNGDDRLENLRWRLP